MNKPHVKPVVYDQINKHKHQLSLGTFRKDAGESGKDDRRQPKEKGHFGVNGVQLIGCVFQCRIKQKASVD